MSEPWEWEDAACRGKPQKWFFPPSDSLGNTAQILLAKGRAVCAECPRFDECRTWSLSQHTELQGMWAGLTPHDRMLERRNRRMAAGNRWECEICGTVLGNAKSYTAHVQHCRRKAAKAGRGG